MRRALLVLVLGGLVAAAPAGAFPPAPVNGWKPSAVTVAPDGHTLYAAGPGGTLAFGIDAATGALTQLPGVQPPGTAIVVSPDGASVYVAGNDALFGLRRDPTTGALLHMWTLTTDRSTPYSVRGVSRLAMSPDGREVYVLSRADRGVAVFARDVATGSLSFAQGVYASPQVGSADDLAISPDGRNAYVAGSQGGYFERASSGLLSAVAGPAIPQGRLALTPDGGSLLAGSSELFSYARDPDTGSVAPGRVFAVEEAEPSAAGPVAFPDRTHALVLDTTGRRLVVVGLDDGTQRFVGTGDYEPGYISTVGMTSAGGAAFSRDGRFVYVAGVASTGAILTYRRAGDDGLTPAGTLVPSLPRRAAGDPSVSIDGGADYTNDPRVTVRLRCPGLEASVLLSNRADLAGGSLLPRSPDGTYAWTLGSNGPVRDVRRVYARCTSVGAAEPVLSDDIVLDRRPPEVIAARVARLRRGRTQIQLRAWDGTSRVRWMQLTRRRDRPGRLVRYATRTRVPRGHGTLWVRVADAATNRSRWRKVAPAPRAKHKAKRR